MQSKRGLTPALLAMVIALLIGALPCAAASPGPFDAQISQLDQLRQQCIAAAEAARQRERTIGPLDLAVGQMQSDLSGKERQIAASRLQQEALLGALERLARAPQKLAIAGGDPVQRVRSGILIAAAVPALAAEARSLGQQMATLATTEGEIAARRKDVDDARAVLVKGRDALGQLVDRRNQLIVQMLHDDNGGAAPASQPGSEAGDVADLIKRSDAAIDQRDKKLLVRLRTLLTVPGKPPPAISDPTRPKSLRALDAPGAQMIWPVTGALVYGFGDADASGQASRGITLQAMPGGLIVAPFDGQVVYAGAFRDNGVILIIRHGGGYHSVLAGFGHLDVTAGQWLLAGEPVGSQPDAKDKSANATFYFELRRDERPIDPQSRLVSRDQRTEETRVRQ